MRREDSLCRSEWSDGVNQIAVGLRCIWPPSLVETTRFYRLVSLSTIVCSSCRYITSNNILSLLSHATLSAVWIAVLKIPSLLSMAHPLLSFCQYFTCCFRLVPMFCCLCLLSDCYWILAVLFQCLLTMVTDNAETG